MRAHPRRRRHALRRTGRTRRIAAARAALAVLLPVLGLVWVQAEQRAEIKLVNSVAVAEPRVTDDVTSTRTPPDDRPAQVRADRSHRLLLRQVTVVVDGARRRVSTEADTVGQLLAELAIDWAARDRVRPAVRQAVTAGMEVTVTHAEVERVTWTERVPFHETEQPTDHLLEGTSEVVREGAEGERTVVAEVVALGGVEQSRTVVSDEITVEAVDRIVAVGTAEPAPEPTTPRTPAVPTPTPTPTPTPQETATPEQTAPATEEHDAGDRAGQPSADPDDDQVWIDLANCESGGNWREDSEPYYGGLQFSLDSWRSVGGAGYPHEYSRDTQIELGRRLQRRQGWEAWPRCARELGLN